jgi:Ca2+-binding EF-hand superfamily protein
MRPIPLIIALGLALAPFIPSPVQGQAQGPGLVLSNVDTNGDGQITKEEYVAYRDQEFERFDRNNDGNLGRDDFSNASRFRSALGRLEDRIRSADKNGDGVLSRAEVHDAPTYMFDRADTSRNGSLSRAEIEAARSAAAKAIQ